MLHKCANPDCSRQFRHLTEGKLFVIEAPSPRPWMGAHARVARLRFRKQYRWLCDDCSQYLSLAFDRGHGTVLMPLRRAAGALKPAISVPQPPAVVQRVAKAGDKSLP